MTDIIEQLMDRHHTLPRGESILMTRDEMAELSKATNEAYGTKHDPSRLPNGCYGLFMGREIYLKYEDL